MAFNKKYSKKMTMTEDLIRQNQKTKVKIRSIQVDEPQNKTRTNLSQCWDNGYDTQNF